jgi:hypothetical protein
MSFTIVGVPDSTNLDSSCSSRSPRALRVVVERRGRRCLLVRDGEMRIHLFLPNA